jgi:hypothetical protein
MNFNMTKLAAALALAVASQAASAATVTGMTIADTINSAGTAALGDDTAGTDGKSGAFRFSTTTINLGTYAGATLWAGDLNSGVIDIANVGAPLDFTTGFLFAGAAFQPFNSGVISGTTSAAADAAAVGTILTGADLSLNIAGWAGLYTSIPFTFNLTPDAGTLAIQNLIKTSANEYAYRLTFAHDITSADDPSLTYTAFTAQWVLEGTVAAVPEASTYGMMLSGLGLVGAVVARRRRSAK